MDDVDDYLHWLRARACSPNTTKSYGHHMAALVTWLRVRGLSWEAVEFTDLGDFMGTYRSGLHPLPERGGGIRSVATMRAAAAAIREFYEFHRVESDRGPTNLRLPRTFTRGGRGNPNHFLAHNEARHKTVGDQPPEQRAAVPQPDFQVINL